MSSSDAIERFSVKEMLQQTDSELVSADISLTQNVIKDLTGIEVEAPITFNIIGAKLDDGVTLTTSTTLPITLQCVRCLDQFGHTASGSVETEYVKRPETEDQNPISERSTVDLTQQLIDTIVLAIPTVPVCKESCLGLCQKCGENLNTHPDHYTTHPNHHETIDTLGNHIRIK